MTEDLQSGELVDYGTPALCTILVDGAEITTDIYSIRLEQHVDKHHVLTVLLRELGVVSSSQEFEDPAVYTAYLGKTLSLDISPTSEIVDASRNLEFIGIVTEVRMDHGINQVNTVVLTAHSPTISLDGHLRENVFDTGMSTADIIGMVMRDYEITRGTIDSVPVTTVDDNLNMEVDSCIQYRETDYNYIKRLASEHKMFAYYNGTEFCVEEAKTNDEEELVWRQTLGSFALGVGTAPVKFHAQLWNIREADEITANADRTSLRASLSDFSGASMRESETVYPVRGVSTAPKHPDQAKVDAALAREVESAAGRMMVCNGVSIVPSIKVGSCVRLRGLGSFDGQYWVQAVTHHIGGGAEYYNRFQCTPLELALPDLKREQQSFTHLMTGTVISNEDPEDLGRIKVSMPWHPQGETQFVRMMTPDGGNERGWFALPEFRDEVVVAYERGNPAMPIVLGCLYNGQNKPPITTSEATPSGEVEVKVFRTRLGNEIRFDDAAGGEKITISQEGSQNTIVLDLSGPSIAITSEGDVSITGTNVTIEATSGNIEMTASADITAEATSNIKAKADMNMELEAGMDLKAKGGMNFKAEGGIGFEAKGGATAKLEGGITEIKGGVVKIN